MKTILVFFTLILTVSAISQEKNNGTDCKKESNDFMFLLFFAGVLYLFHFHTKNEHEPEVYEYSSGEDEEEMDSDSSDEEEDEEDEEEESEGEDTETEEVPEPEDGEETSSTKETPVIRRRTSRTTGKALNAEY